MDRRRLGEQLERYVDRLQCGAVLALDARRGEGENVVCSALGKAFI